VPSWAGADGDDDDGDDGNGYNGNGDDGNGDDGNGDDGDGDDGDGDDGDGDGVCDGDHFTRSNISIKASTDLVCSISQSFHRLAAFH
jgi:hypothetical protein